MNNNGKIEDKSGTLDRLLSRYEEGLPKRNEASPTEDSFSYLLPKFTLMQEISSCKSEERLSQCEHIMKRIQSLQEMVEKLDGITHSIVNIAQNLKNIVALSHLVNQQLKNTTRNGSIPLPQEHHTNILQIINNCLQIVTDLANSTLNTKTVNWPMVSSTLKSTIDMYKHMSEFFNSNIQEHEILRSSTIKLLEQMSKLEFHDI